MRTTLLLLCGCLATAVAVSSPQCGGVLRAPRGSFHTPHFPGAFPVPLRCRWLLDNSRASGGEGSLLVLRLTQVYVTVGLAFTEFVHYEPGSPQFQLGGRVLHPVPEALLYTARPYLLVDFSLDALEGNHLRALDGLLDVYGFNITYETLGPGAIPSSCSVANCSFSGHCYASADYSRFECSCFDGFSGVYCSQGALCRPGRHSCKPGEQCRQLGSTMTYCVPQCPVGANCTHVNNNNNNNNNNISNNVTDIEFTTGCGAGGCAGYCPPPHQAGGGGACKCPLNSALPTDRARYQGTVRLANLTALRDILRQVPPSFQAALEKQLSKYLRSAITNITELRVLNISSMGEVTFHFSGERKDGGKVREVLNRLVERGWLGNHTLVSTHIALKQEPTLSLQRVSVNQGKPLVREGDPFNITCTAEGSAFMSFRWYKDGAVVNVSKAHREMWEVVSQADSQDQYVCVLGAREARRLDEGRYTCQVLEWGRRQCRSVTLGVLKAPEITVLPRSLTVRKGHNASIVCMCREDGRHEKFGYNWTKNKLLLPLSPGKEVWEDLQPVGSILRLFHLERTARYACLVHGNQASRSSAVQVDVLEGASTPTCAAGEAAGLAWPETAPHGVALLDCPVPRSGLASRRCSLRDGSRAAWMPPDMSDCVHPTLASISEQLESLSLGYETTTVSEILSRCQRYLAKNKLAIFAGEGKAVVSLLRSLQQYLDFTRSTEDLLASRDIFLKITDQLLADRRSLKHHQSVSTLQQTVRTMASWWGSSRPPAARPAHAGLAHFTLDVVQFNAQEVVELHFPLPNFSYPSWFRDHVDLRIEGHASELTKKATVIVIVYKNLMQFLPRREVGRQKDGQEFQYELMSHVVSVEMLEADVHLSVALQLEHVTEGGHNCSECEVMCAVSPVGTSLQAWRLDLCLTEVRPAERHTLCHCHQPGSYTLLLTTSLLQEGYETGENYHLVVVLGCLLCLLQTVVTLLLLLPCWWQHRNCIIYLKLQCCTATSGAMGVFIYAVRDSLPQTSFPYVSTSLEALLLIGISSHLSKVLIIYTEVVQLPKVRYLKKTVISIITGLPMITALCSHMAHDSLGRQLHSWWLIYGTVLFNVFATAMAGMVAMFIFLYCSVMRRLHVVCEKKMLDASGVTKRVGFLRRGATIFSFMLVVDVSSVCYVNLHSRSYHYIFSLSSALLGSIIFVCYIWKSETPLCFWMLFKLKVGESMKDAKQNSSPLKSTAKQVIDGRTQRESPWKHFTNSQGQDTASSDAMSLDLEMETRKKVASRAPLPDVAPCTEDVATTSDEALSTVPNVNIQPYLDSPGKYEHTLCDYVVRQEAPGSKDADDGHQEVIMAKVCLELGLISSRQRPCCSSAEDAPRHPPTIVLCSVDMDPKPIQDSGLNPTVLKALLQDDAATDSKSNLQVLEQETASNDQLQTSTMEDSSCKVSTSVQDEETNQPFPKTDQLPGDNIDCMLDRISQDLDYLLERNFQKDNDKSVCLSVFE